MGDFKNWQCFMGLSTDSYYGNLGWDKGQAQAYSALVGISEVALSKALGGITKFGGGEGILHSISLPLLQNVDNAVGRVALKIGANMLDEGLEENLQEILEPWFESVITGAKYEAASADVLYAGLLGMMTAGVIEGPETVSKEWNLYIQGREFQNAGVSSQDLAELGKRFSMDSEAYRLAGKIDENTGAYTIGRLLNEIGVSMTEQNIADITSLLKAKGMDPEIARKNAMVMAYIADGGVLSDVQMRMIEKNDVLAEVMRELIQNPDSVVNQRTNGYNQILQQVESGGTRLGAGSKQGWRNAAEYARQGDLNVMDALNRAGLSGSADLARANPQAYAQSFQEALKNGVSYDQALMRATADVAMKVVDGQVPMDTLLYNIGGDTNKAVSILRDTLNRAGIDMSPGELNLLGIIAAEASAYRQEPSFQRDVAIEMLKQNSKEAAWTAASETLWQEATDRVIAHGIADKISQNIGLERLPDGRRVEDVNRVVEEYIQTRKEQQADAIAEKLRYGNEYAQVKESLGKNAPKSLEEFRDLKYSSGEWGQFQSYWKSIENGELSAFANFELYKKANRDIDNSLVGITTSNGVSIMGKDDGFISDMIGSVDERRSGIDIKNVYAVLTDPNTKVYPPRTGADGNVSQKFRLGSVNIFVNPETGNLICAVSYGG